VFERFEDRARRVVVMAQEEARRLHHGHIGTEHLLLALVLDDESPATRALAALDVDPLAVRTRVVEIVGHGEDAPSGHIPFTADAKRALEGALRECVALGHHGIGPDHLLLGLLWSKDGVAARVLGEFGVDLDDARRVIVELRTGEPAPDEPTPQFQTTHYVSRGVLGFPAAGQAGCAFCGRDVYEVERMVTNGAGVLLCIDCARDAVQQMEHASDAPVPLRPLSLPPRVFGDPPDDTAVDEIVALIESWPRPGPNILDRTIDGASLRPVSEAIDRLHPPGTASDVTFAVDRIRFVAPDHAAVRFRISREPHMPLDGSVVRVDGVWMITRDTYCMVARMAGVHCPPPL
jgi:hypothetical protein